MLSKEPSPASFGEQVKWLRSGKNLGAPSPQSQGQLTLPQKEQPESVVPCEVMDCGFVLVSSYHYILTLY